MLTELEASEERVEEKGKRKTQIGPNKASKEILSLTYSSFRSTFCFVAI